MHSTTLRVHSINPRLVPLEPESLGQHPFGRHPARDEPQYGIARSADDLCLLERPLIHPEQGRAEGHSVFISRHDGARRTVKSDADHLLGRRVPLRKCKANRLCRCRPPIKRLLLGPCRMRISRLDLCDSECHRTALQVNQGRPQTLRPNIQPKQKPRPFPRRFHVKFPQCCEIPNTSIFPFPTSSPYARLSSRNVTGPSLINSTFIIAPKTPVPTVSPGFSTSLVKRDKAPGRWAVLPPR